MLNPRTDRIDYGEKLRAPEGFTLSHGLATTYSLDLETLLCLPLALSLNASLDGEPQDEKLAILEGISQLKDKVRVFFQQGQVHLPRQFNLLFSLLEPMLVPQVPGQAFSAFHPKVWLLRFSDARGRVRYRLLVLTRNLTFDRSWDLAVALEGEVSASRSEQNTGVLQLLQDLAPHAGDFSGFRSFKRELPKVHWQLPAGFNGLDTLMGRPGQVPLDLGGEVDTLLVMSPFLHPEALDRLRQQGQRHWLFSRAEALDSIGQERLAGWECFALNARLVNAEDELSNARPQDLHAKLVLAQQGTDSHWHIGSANATKAALGGLVDGPRNTEFMLRLSSRGAAQSAEQLRTELVGDAQAPTGIFVPHVFSVTGLAAQADTDPKLREVLYRLIGADWRLWAQAGPEQGHTCVLDYTPQQELPQVEVTVRPLAAGQPQALAAQLVWPGLSLLQLSAFLVVQVRMPSGDKAELLIRARLEIEGGDDRERKIFSSFIDSPHKLLAYLQMLLQPDAGRSAWPAPGKGGAKPADALIGQWLAGPLHEGLLRCAARQPEKLQRIDAVLRHLRGEPGLVPPELERLWDQYRQFLGKKSA